MIQSQAWDLGISTGYQASGMQFRVLPRTIKGNLFSKKEIMVSTKNKQIAYKSQTGTVARPKLSRSKNTVQNNNQTSLKNSTWLIIEDVHLDLAESKNTVQNKQSDQSEKQHLADNWNSCFCFVPWYKTLGEE